MGDHQGIPGFKRSQEISSSSSSWLCLALLARRFVGSWQFGLCLPLGSAWPPAVPFEKDPMPEGLPEGTRLRRERLAAPPGPRGCSGLASARRGREPARGPAAPLPFPLRRLYRRPVSRLTLPGALPTTPPTVLELPPTGREQLGWLWASAAFYELSREARPFQALSLYNIKGIGRGCPPPASFLSCVSRPRAAWQHLPACLPSTLPLALLQSPRAPSPQPSSVALA